ncbi:amino acid deaminase [Microbacterium sp. YY-01]|uniref:amino acid deaminase n=1 Tax=Microbacterium sp. YY-01 TaxID=3421634 RepID=UPI003D18487C
MQLIIPDPVLGPWAKGIAPRLHGLPLSEVAAAEARLSEFPTPVFTVHEAALTHNETTVFAWAREQGVLMAPHGKTSMSPALWQRLLDAGAWGITLATPWQAQLAISSGVPTVLIAHGVVDHASVQQLAAQLDARPGLRVICWADSVEAVNILQRGMDGSSAVLDVLVEIGGMKGRTGARSIDDGVAIAKAIHGASHLRLAGIGGYEGPFGSERTAHEQDSVDAYLSTFLTLHSAVGELYDGSVRPILSAGGSAWPDRVAAVLSQASETADVVVRSGAFQIHDDGLYRRVSPFGKIVDTAPLRSAMHVWSRVVSRPEPDLALLDAGRRDASFDNGLPEPQGVDGEVIKLNDQHAFLRLPEDSTVAIGDVIRLGVSHPCTVFDKWRVGVVIDDPDAADPRVIGAFATCF